jgi:hypothetical protein
MPIIDRLRPVVRQQGTQIPNLIPTSRWIDSRALAAGVSEPYAIPTDAAGAKAAILGISATAGPIYINFAGTATVVNADVSDGTASIMLRTDAGGSYLISVPPGATSMSLICAATSVVSIEAWQ